MSESDNVIGFEQRAGALRGQKDHQRKEARVKRIQAQFERALPKKKKPVSDHMARKRAKKKR